MVCSCGSLFCYKVPWLLSSLESVDSELHVQIWLPDMATETIASIRLGRSDAILQVRVIRKWAFSSRPDEPWYLFVDRNIGFCSKNCLEDISVTIWKETLATFDRAALDTVNNPVLWL
ncbi:hypothetical protein L1987_39675 [Smallanthus sonchifolius]|uniref:Uncharacterized protein n=1 Tax=Smallanthus sonchifolius TaxID=185202 RepID=A0ACB9HMG0_9ASTR|nr:hypothetical protein L1987_39675 [Smallanthus sonchifolius]